MRVGYIGLGAMGAALASRLMASRPLLVWDLDPAAIESAVAQGAIAASSARRLAEACDVVFLCLPQSAIVEKVLFGPDGIASSLAIGSIIVDQTSGSPAPARQIATRLADLGVSIIEAPVSGGVPSARAGQATIIAAGADVPFERVADLLREISPRVFLCSSRCGDGHALKSINNVMNAACRIATLEMVALGRALGLDTAALTTRLRAGPARSFVTDRLLPAVAEGRSSTDFALGLMVKDLMQAQAVALKAGVATPLSDTARGVIQIAYRVLGPAARLDDLVSFVETVAGIRFVGGADSGADDGAVHGNRDETISLIEACLADANRSIALENEDVARGWGLDVGAFAPVLLSGSAGSAAAERHFSGATSEPADDIAALARFDRLVALGARAGVPLLMTDQIRAGLIATRHPAR